MDYEQPGGRSQTVLPQRRLKSDGMELTNYQLDGVRSYLIELLLPIFEDMREREAVIDTIFNDVVLDIETTADWSELEDDEVHTGDISIALARVLKGMIEYTYDTEI